MKEKLEDRGVSHYSRGANFERRVAAYYKDKGFLVIRSAGSHSPVDLVALRAGEVILIQVKIDGRLSKIAREQLIELGRENKCQVHFVSRIGKKLVMEELT
jgi:Holliday junction resolvase